MPGALGGRREPVGAQPGRAHRVQPAEQFGVRRAGRASRACRPSTVTWASRPCLQPARHRLQQRLRRVRRAGPRSGHARPTHGPRRAISSGRTARRARVPAATGRPSRPSPRRRQCMPSSIGSPRSAASRTLAGEVQATTTSGPCVASVERLVRRPRHHRDLAEAEALAVGRRRAARAASAAADRATPGSPSRTPRGPPPKTSRSTQGPPRPTPSEKRPPEVRCSSAACSPSATGWAVGSTLTAVPTPDAPGAAEQQRGQGHRRRARRRTARSGARPARPRRARPPRRPRRTAPPGAAPPPGPGPGTGPPARNVPTRIALLPPCAPTRQLPHRAITSDTCQGHGLAESFAIVCRMSVRAGRRLCRVGAVRVPRAAPRRLDTARAPCTSPVRCPVSPRRNRPKGGADRPAGSAERATGPAATAAGSARRAGRARSGRCAQVAGASAAGKTYRCPGCDQEIPLRGAACGGLAASTRGVDDRRHWHKACWNAKDRRTTRVQRSRNAPRY